MTDMIPEMEMVSTGKILVDESNPNVMSDKTFSALKKNIREYGFLVPVITNKDYKICDGFHRWKAARELGLTEIPVIALGVSDVDRRILRQVLNKLRGRHDPKKDKAEFEFIQFDGGLDDLKNLLPEVDLSCLEEVDLDTSEKVGKVYSLQLECPKCGHKYKKGEGK